MGSIVPAVSAFLAGFLPAGLEIAVNILRLVHPRTGSLRCPGYALTRLIVHHLDIAR